jgi:hypothetical protein
MVVRELKEDEIFNLEKEKRTSTIGKIIFGRHIYTL